MSPGKQLALALSVAVFVVTWIAPPWPQEQAMHSSLTVLGLIGLCWHDRRWPMRVPHFALVCLFIALHSVAARWLYSYVPYEQWWRALSATDPGALAEGRRNHADRLIHLLYGVCFAPGIHHHLRQRWPLTSRQAFVIAVMVIMCTSLIYEWLEWAIALLMSPEAAESYNGQQGDPWDAHADMLLATLGALLTWPWLRAPRQPEATTLVRIPDAGPD